MSFDKSDVMTGQVSVPPFADCLYLWNFVNGLLNLAITKFKIPESLGQKIKTPPHCFVMG
jgi:hypothetical protein